MYSFIYLGLNNLNFLYDKIVRSKYKKSHLVYRPVQNTTYYMKVKNLKRHFLSIYTNSIEILLKNIYIVITYIVVKT